MPALGQKWRELSSKEKNQYNDKAKIMFRENGITKSKKFQEKPEEAKQPRKKHQKDVYEDEEASGESEDENNDKSEESSDEDDESQGFTKNNKESVGSESDSNDNMSDSSDNPEDVN
jgi:hypothetical protein